MNGTPIQIRLEGELQIKQYYATNDAKADSDTYKQTIERAKRELESETVVIDSEAEYLAQGPVCRDVELIVDHYLIRLSKPIPSPGARTVNRYL